ncbi:hypothetical protein NQ317_008255 [Molorchus minor]|uniref:Uncharacterized protein n=1 Tax=Molorchus minor TaxID=1323400 RepID=A0ABQ9J8V0_9CUCU|nr:hypothetical protein NQ317_008255 [Molorchus minor]
MVSIEFDSLCTVLYQCRKLLTSCVWLFQSSPMSARNFPPSFWNSQHYGGVPGAGHHGASAADLYSEHYHPGDAWYQYSQHHRAVHDYHHHNMAAQYGGLLLPGSRLHMSSHAPCEGNGLAAHPSIESPYSSYPTMSDALFSHFYGIWDHYNIEYIEQIGLAPNEKDSLEVSVRE